MCARVCSRRQIILFVIIRNVRSPKVEEKEEFLNVLRRGKDDLRERVGKGKACT